MPTSHKSTDIDQARVLADITAHPGSPLRDVIRRTGMDAETAKGALISLGKRHAIYGDYTERQLRVYYPAKAMKTAPVDAYLTRGLPKLNPGGACSHTLLDRGRCPKSPEPPAHVTPCMQSSLGGLLGSGL